MTDLLVGIYCSRVCLLVSSLWIMFFTDGFQTEGRIIAVAGRLSQQRSQSLQFPIIGCSRKVAEEWQSLNQTNFIIL